MYAHVVPLCLRNLERSWSKLTLKLYPGVDGESKLRPLRVGVDATRVAVHQSIFKVKIFHPYPDQISGLTYNLKEAGAADSPRLFSKEKHVKIKSKNFALLDYQLSGRTYSHSGSVFQISD